MKPLGEFEIWFVTGTQQMYGDAVLRSVDEHAREVAAALDAAAAIPVSVRHKGMALTPESIRRACLDAERGERLHRRHRLDAHLLAGQDVDRRACRRCGSRSCTCTRSSAATCPTPTIDMDFMNLNQSAHGDREFAYIVYAAAPSGQDHRRALAGPRRAGPHRHWARAAAVRARRALKVCRFGDNMREVAVTEGDKVEVQARLGTAVNTYPINELADAVARVADAEVDRLCAEYDEAYEVVPELRREASGASRYVTPPASSWACAASWTRAASAPSPTPSRTSAPQAAARHRGAAPHGRRLRLRRGGRLEDRHAGAPHQGHERRAFRRRHLLHGGLHLRLRPADAR